MAEGYGMRWFAAMASGKPKRIEPRRPAGAQRVSRRQGEEILLSSLNLRPREQTSGGGDPALVVRLTSPELIPFLLLTHLSLQVDVETLDFDRLADPQAHDEVDDLQDDVSHDGAVDEGSSHTVELD